MCVCVGLRAKSLVQSLIHFTDEETEAQKNEMICESQWMEEALFLGGKPGGGW